MDTFTTNNIINISSNDYMYNTKEDCRKKIVFNKINNPKFHTFDQIIFHAGNLDDINRYGFLYTYLTRKKINIPPQIHSKYFFNLEQPMYSMKEIYRTFSYISNHLKKGIYIAIRNNKLDVYLPFSKYNYTNDFYNMLFIDDVDKTILQKLHNAEFKLKDKSLIEHYEEKSIRYFKSKINEYNLHRIIPNRRKWYANNCLFRNRSPEYEGDINIALLYHFFKILLKKKKIPDVEFFLNCRDFPILRKDYKHPYDVIYEYNPPLINEKFVNKKFAPILSFTSGNSFRDIPVPTNDDIYMSIPKFFLNDCSNPYINQKVNHDWESKKEIAVFRGSSTGCHIGFKNPRLLATKMSKERPDLLDAGITNLNNRMRKTDKLDAVIDFAYSR